MHDHEQFLLTGRTLEDAFFIERDRKLAEQRAALRSLAETKKNLEEVSGIHNDRILQKLVDLQIPPQLVASLAMVPLVEVAWADGTVGGKEREVIIREAHIDSEVDKTIIESWLTHRPEPTLLDAWVHYVEGLCENLDDNDRKALKDSIMEPAWAVARAEGGVLGLGNKVSTAERRVLNALEAAFARP